MKRKPPLAALLTLTATFGCEQVIDIDIAGPVVIDDSTGDGEGEGGPPDPPQPPPGPPPAVTCPTPTTEAPTPALLQQRFGDDIYPLMMRSEGGCIACHAGDSGRLMRMADDAVGTYFRLDGQGYLGLNQGGMASRILDASMPVGGPSWTSPEMELVTNFVCDVTRVVGGGIPADERFPPELAQPFVPDPNAPPLQYDNTFVGYHQLRGRVLQAFNDDWVRNNVDQFSAQIELLGGADFITTFTSDREATPEFLVGLELLGEDVCARAVDDGTGPFAGIDTAASLQTGAGAPESTLSLGAAGPDAVYINGNGGTDNVCAFPSGNTSVNLCSFASVRVPYDAPATGNYRVIVRAEGQESGPDLPEMELRVDGVVQLTVGVPGGAISSHEFTMAMPAGPHGISAHFTNDYGDANSDRNLVVYDFRMVGPIGGVAGDSSTSPTRVAAATVMQRMLLRPIGDDEVTPVLQLLQALGSGFGGGNRSAWTGVCEALFQHPDFLFTRPPSAESSDRESPTWERSLLIKSALDLMNRTPTEAELQRFDAGLSRLELIDEWLLSDDYLTAYRNRVREVLEYNGTPDGEEPARLWAYVMDADKPLKEILTATYTVDDNLQQVNRPAEHGQTGLLTMKGYISGKPGLPHYNYAARVFTGFMGTVFVVPQEALDARATATPASTVDTASVCYSCHRVLTPLSHQRLAWDDDGNYRTADEQGVAIDDSDRGMVADYPYAGSGMESFSLVAVRKEAFVRRMANLHFLVSFGRAMREERDERDVYQGLYAAMDAGNGTFRDLVRAIHMSRSFVRPVTGQGG